MDSTHDDTEVTAPDPIDAKLSGVMDEVEDALASREGWETRQKTYYDLRHNGVKRAAKPWPGAADMNWPLSDMMIEKIKPYYIQQTFANELVANFYALRRDLQTDNTLAAQWFDYKIRQCTNFETEIISVADYMLSMGKGILKVRWDADIKRVAFDAVDPMYLVVPTGTVDLVDTDWVVQVHQISVDEYQRNELYDQSILNSLVASSKDAPKRIADDSKFAREGITHSVADNTIVLWEVYEKNEDGEYQVFTMSPYFTSAYVRPPMTKPHGKTKHPFVEFNAEVKDKGYYASRGIPERVAPIQLSMSKLWNEKLDAITVFNRPIFTSENPLANAGNIRMIPGSLIPFPVRKVQMDTPPINWDSEINQHRLTAEQMIGVPDAGLSQIANNERRTASEVNLIGSIMSQVVDLRSRIFRKALATTFQYAWTILVEESQKDLEFFFQNEMKSFKADALMDEYRIEPLASADNLNSQFVYRKKLERFQLLQNNPYVNQSNLVKDLIAAGDPQDVKTLHMDVDEQGASQAEDQASEISRMLIGFPSQVKPVDDDAVHLGILKGFVERRLQTGEGVDPELATLLANHANLHFRQLQHKQPEVAAEMQPQLEQMVQFLGTIVGEAQAAQQIANEGGAVGSATDS